MRMRLFRKTHFVHLNPVEMLTALSLNLIQERGYALCGGGWRGGGSASGRTESVPGPINRPAAP
jgi:hypothetical protein